MPRLISKSISFVVRCITALRYMRKLNYSRRLAWAKAAR